MRARSALSPVLLAKAVEETLVKLNFSFRKNQGHFLSEYEILFPCRLLVTVEDVTHLQLGYPFRSRLRVESAIEVRRMVPSTESREELTRHASSLVRGILSSLPQEPWKGLGRTARIEKSNWEGLGEPE